MEKCHFSGRLLNNFADLKISVTLNLSSFSNIHILKPLHQEQLAKLQSTMSNLDRDNPRETKKSAGW